MSRRTVRKRIKMKIETTTNYRTDDKARRVAGTLTNLKPKPALVSSIPTEFTILPFSLPLISLLGEEEDLNPFYSFPFPPLPPWP